MRQSPLFMLRGNTRLLVMQSPLTWTGEGEGLSVNLSNYVANWGVVQV